MARGKDYQPHQGPVSETQEAALAHIKRCAVGFGPPPLDMDGPGALGELRAARSYEGETATVASLNFGNVDKISLPFPVVATLGFSSAPSTGQNK